MTVLIPCRPAEPHEIPKTASSLAKLAAGNGWTVRTTYALARVASSTRGPKDEDGKYQMIPVEKDVRTIAVRMRRETRLAGIWYEGKFESGLVPYRRVSAATLRLLVTMNRDELRENALGIKALEAIIR